MTVTLRNPTQVYNYLHLFNLFNVANK